MQANLEIVRVLSVVDTRACGDDDKPIAGSGEERECDRCSRVHEVHAHVELSNGETAIVGTGCSKGESLEVRRALTRGARNATKLNALRAKLARENATNAAWLEMLGRWTAASATIEPVRGVNAYGQDSWMVGEEGFAVFVEGRRAGDRPTWEQLNMVRERWAHRRTCEESQALETATGVRVCDKSICIRSTEAAIARLTVSA